MRLLELEPEFIRYRTDRAENPPVRYRQFLHPQEDRPLTFEEAQGVDFLCPECFARNGGPVGTHHIEVTFADRGAADDEGSHNSQGAPSRWRVSGSTLEDLTLQPSIDISKDNTVCSWHGYITAGEVR